MKVIIPLAGAGTRMRPHTHTKAKPLLTIAGKVGLSYFLDELKDYDVSELICITGHLKHQVEEFITKNYKFKTRFIEQKTLNGTAGAIGLAEQYVDEPVLIAFVDAVFVADLSLIKKLKDGESAIIWAKETEDYQRYGVCVLDDQGYMTRMVEKPKEPISKLANIGLYYVKDYKLFFRAIRHVFEKNLQVNGEYYLPHAFEYMISHGAKIICPPVEGWYDFGKPETLLESNRELLKRAKSKMIKMESAVFINPVDVSGTAKIMNSIIGPYVSIGDGAVIKDSIIRDSVIGENAKVTDSMLEESIIGDHAEVDGQFQKLNIGDHSTASISRKTKRD